MTISRDLLHLLAFLLPLIHLLGIGFALDAVWRSRTPQAATAWAIALFSFPYATIPMYLIFGRNRFQGYVRARRSHDATLKSIADDISTRADASQEMSTTGTELPAFRVLQNLARMPFTKGNSAELLIDGEATFASIFKGIESAKKYVLVQFYIARNDELGTRLADLLKKKVAEGVTCFYLFDEVGSHTTPKKYWRDLQSHGVKTSSFNSRRGGWRNRFQINFRNHRKIVVVDGVSAFVGGHNVGDDYLGKGPLGPWRDTHVKVTGPSVAAIQLSFVEDWHWAQGEVLSLQWTPVVHPKGDLAALALPTGPADDRDNCSLMFSQLISSAKTRLWIASPYFVPDPEILSQLKLAALRGVDVRVLIPEKADHLLTHLASFAFIGMVERSGVKFFRYRPAFTHQKVVLVDNQGGAIGTANLDNRSINLNFEISLLFAGQSLTQDVENMLADDFSKSIAVPLEELANFKFSFRLAVRIARLFSPIL